ncbi:hypothetical protein GW17_00046634, partial [Ensete ventricosum]
CLVPRDWRLGSPERLLRLYCVVEGWGSYYLIDGIEPSLTLFLACFRIGKGWGSYYLIAMSGFKVDGTPSNNKGWKSHFFFVSTFICCGFGLKWIDCDVDNSPPFLLKEEVEQVAHLRGILSSSKAIKSMSKDWLVEAGLSLIPRGMARLILVAWDKTDVHGVDLAPCTFSDACAPTAQPDAIEEVEWPVKKMKVLVTKPPTNVAPVVPAAIALRKETLAPTVFEKEAAPHGEGSSKC